MKELLPLEFLERLAKGLAAQFGSNCEVVVHDMSMENTILIIENGHVSNRKVGDGPSHVVLDALKAGDSNLDDHIAYLTKTHDGRILKSSTIFIKDENGMAQGILSINYDITGLMMAENALASLVSHSEDEKEPSRIPTNINDLLDELIEESVKFTGKPVALMTKDDKIKAIKFLNDAGAFMITRSGDKVSQHFGISKYTLYSYLDVKGKNQKKND
ncbi:helix-turn-helix transcriptional regulator [Christensenellaceae bacterium OttesenSCG-928-K19]|nr:helix-turn-helix transcriptional regulator [Christensenellaceae bacterium OttesenSCG-928-K19]